MTTLARRQRSMLSALRRATQPIRRRLADDDPERGDVPGWVLITIMTAGLVTALWLIAGDLLVQLFVDAVEAVTGP